MPKKSLTCAKTSSRETTSRDPSMRLRGSPHDQWSYASGKFVCFFVVACFFKRVTVVVYIVLCVYFVCLQAILWVTTVVCLQATLCINVVICVIVSFSVLGTCCNLMPPACSPFPGSPVWLSLSAHYSRFNTCRVDTCTHKSYFLWDGLETVQIKKSTEDKTTKFKNNLIDLNCLVLKRLLTAIDISGCFRIHFCELSAVHFFLSSVNTPKELRPLKRAPERNQTETISEV